MKNSTSWLTALAGAASLILAGNVLADDNRYIVQFAPGAAGNGKADIQALGGQVEIDMTNRSINAMAITIPAQAVQALQNNPNIINVEVDQRRYPMADTVPYGIEMVQATLVGDDFAGNQKVCVIDSGYYIDHVDLQSNNVTATYDSRSGDPFIDPCGHGTHVTGTISALANGGGVLGVLPSANVALHIVKVFGDDNWSGGSCGWSYSSSLADAAYKCGDAGATVINMSLGGGTSSSTEEQAFQSLFDQGVLSVAAAGNSGNTSYSYPASYDAVISVAAIDSNKELASFSQRNDQVELSAPGVGVLSTTPFVSAQVTVDRDYVAEKMDGSSSTSATGDLVDGGLCTSSGSWSGKVVLCERGEISFGDKVSNAESGGAVGTIVYNNEPGGFGGTLNCGGPSWATCSSGPAVSMSQEDGQHLVANQLGASAFVTTEEVVPADGYAAWNGTSMASPHVAAVAALVWSYAPDASPGEIRAALAASAEDLGTEGRNNEFGYGLVQAKAALDYLGGDTGGDDGGDDGGTDPEPNEPPTASFTYSCTELDCTFDGSASTDSDGTIESYSWTFGDGNSASGAVVSHTYANDGTYTVTLTVTDNDGDSDSTSQQVTVESAPDDGVDSTVSVASIEVRTRARGPWRNGEAFVTVVDSNGNTVGGANVTGTFSGDVSGTSTATTGSNGVAGFESSRVRQNSISFEFCVDSISHPDFDYDSTGNAVTCVSN